MSKPDLRLLTQWLNPVLVSGLEDRRYLKNEWSRHRKLATLETLWLSIPLLRLEEVQESEGVDCPNFDSLPLLFLLFPSIGKTPPCKVLFSPEDTLCSLAFGLFFSLTRSFPPFILFLSKSKFLSVTGSNTGHCKFGYNQIRNN